MSERYLANENFPAGVVKQLRDAGDDVAHAAETLVGASDETILAAGVAEDRVLLTFDRDFGELVFRRRHAAAPGIVLFRPAQLPPDAMTGFLTSFFDSKPSLRGFFTVSSPGRFRQLPLPR